MVYSRSAEWKGWNDFLGPNNFQPKKDTRWKMRVTSTCVLFACIFDSANTQFSDSGKFNFVLFLYRWATEMTFLAFHFVAKTKLPKSIDFGPF